MTLLEATSCVIAWAREVQQLSGSPNKELTRALKRLEKRLEVLRYRQANALRRRRQKGWAMFVHLLGDPAVCPFCKFDICFGDFCKHSTINNRGYILESVCPSCDTPIVVLFVDGNASTYMVGRQLEGRRTLDERLTIHP